MLAHSEARIERHVGDLVACPGVDMTTITWLVRSPNFFKGYFPDAVTKFSNGSSAKSEVRVYSAENRQYRLNIDSYGRALLSSADGVSSIAVEGPQLGRFDAPVRDLPAALSALKPARISFSRTGELTSNHTGRSRRDRGRRATLGNCSTSPTTRASA